VDDPAGASSQQREECRCGLLLTVEVPANQYLLSFLHVLDVVSIFDMLCVHIIYS